jgi:hypothetical protein
MDRLTHGRQGDEDAASGSDSGIADYGAAVHDQDRVIRPGATE